MPRRNPGRAAKQERLEVKGVLSCDLKKAIKDRADKKKLKRHLKAIEEHRGKWQLRIRAAKALLKKGNASQKHAIPSYKAKVTEAIGEKAATLLMIQHYKEHQLIWGFSAGVGIDQLYHRPATLLQQEEYIIVEAKGPGATLSTDAAKGDQMSKQWVINSLKSVVNSPSATADDIQHAKNMLRAIYKGPPPRVLGRVISADKNGGGNEVTCPNKGIYHK